MAKKKTADDAPAAPPAPRPVASPELEAKIREFNSLDNEVAELEQRLGDVKARRKYCGEHEMIEVTDPDVRASGVILSDGTEWEFEQRYECSVKEDDKAAAFQFLEEHEAGNLLKRRITLAFGKDSRDRVVAFRAQLARLLPQYEVGLRVGKAPGTLVDAIKELLEAAGLFPVVDVSEELELPGATMRAWVIKQLKLGQTLPGAFSVYAPLRAKQVMVSAPAAPEEVEAATAAS
jgi:hypothetical protein